MAEALEQPTGRAVLLDEDARVLALGSTMQPEPKLPAGLAVTYAFFEPEKTFGARVLANDMPGATVQGFVWETHDLDAIEFPKELLQEGDLAFAVGVTYYRAKGGAWGQYAVLFVVVKMATSTKV